MSDFNFDSVFDFDSEKLTTFDTPTGGGVERFNPKPEGSKKYIVTLRLLPFLKSVENSIVFKKLHWLEDAGGNFSCDSSSTLGGYCPVSKVYFSLDRSEIPAKKELAKDLRIAKQYMVYVQIVNDITKPENNGKVLPWQIPVDVYKKIESWMKPSEEEIASGKTAKAFLKPFASYNLILTVSNKTEGAKAGQTFRGYDVELTDGVKSLVIDGVELTDTPEGKKQFVEFLQEKQTVDLVEQFGYKEPDAGTKARVKALLVSKFGADGNTFWNDVEAKAPTPADNGTPSIVGDTATASPSQPATVVTETSTETTQDAQGTDADLDAILDQIQK